MNDIPVPMSMGEISTYEAIVSGCQTVTVQPSAGANQIFASGHSPIPPEDDLQSFDPTTSLQHQSQPALIVGIGNDLQFTSADIDSLSSQSVNSSSPRS